MNTNAPKIWDITIDDTSLMYLNNCAKSSRLGMVDQGMPEYLQGLSLLGLTKPVNNGYQVTLEGEAFLKLPDIRERLRKI